MKKTKWIVLVLSTTFFIGIERVSASSAVNDYILKNNITPAREQVNYRITMQNPANNGGINMNFKFGKPQMVIIHDVGVEFSTIDNEITYMVNHQDSAFVHSFVDGSQLKTIADTSKIAWGAGPFGNRYADQIEQIRVNSKGEFAQQIASLANWTANQMIRYGMGAPKLVSIANKDLDGNLASHENISYKWGGTDHVDPVAYWNGRGQKYFYQKYDMNQFRDLVAYYYNKSSFDTMSNQKTVNYSAQINENGRNDGLFIGGPWRATNSSMRAAGMAPQYDQQHVTVTQTADTKNGSWSEIMLSTGQKYWIDSRALQAVDAMSNQKVVNYAAEINENGRNDGLFVGGPWRATISSMRAASMAPQYDHQTVTVTQTADTKNGSWAEILLTSGQKYWVDIKALKSINAFDAMSNQKTVNYSAQINENGRNDGLFIGGPWRATVSSMRAAGMAPQYHQQRVTVTQTADTKNGRWAEITLTSGQRYWIDIRALKTLESFDAMSNQKAVNYQARINENGRNDGLFIGGPWRATLNSMHAAGMAPQYDQQTVTVTQTADTKNGSWAEITMRSGQKYWIDLRALSASQTPTGQKDININQLSLTGVSATQKQWLSNLLPDAVTVARNNNLWPSVVLSQAITESAWGQSELATQANNLFGVKATSDWHGAVYNVKTREVAHQEMSVVDFTNKTIHVKKGDSYYVMAAFKKYTTQADGLNDYVDKMATNYRQALRSNSTNYRDAATHLQQAGYATDPNYASSMITRIARYVLNAFD
ncbi:MAG TPA: 1,4-beta-N-acetylmuramidase [Leuconostoc citreum]|nr:1,4-beta-N-acetylmuramidase [Leuconostoc citreum]